MFAAGEATEAYYEPAGGYVRPEAAVAAQLELARRRGARLRLGEHVTSWAASPHGVVVSTDTDNYAGEQLLLCAGAWIGDLFPGGRDLFAVYRQLLYWFPIRDGLSAAARHAGLRVGLRRRHRMATCTSTASMASLRSTAPTGASRWPREAYEQTTVPDGRQHSGDAGRGRRDV